MKLQAVTIIFSLIVVPIVLILGFYIQAQVDTISLQTSYDTKLLDATHDAMAALELNTANESLSSVADALRSIITASNNVFINSLATNLGMSSASHSMIEPYIPAVLYTLYDGYYIYSPTKTPVVLTNKSGNAVTVGDYGVESAGAPQTINGCEFATYKYTEPTYDEVTGEVTSETNLTIPAGYEADYGQVLYKLAGTEELYTTVVREDITEYKSDFVLKSYMPYSARYIGKSDDSADAKDVDVVVNYTLDNYMILNGTVGESYFSKSGYLIKDDLINVSIIEGINAGEDLLSYNEEEVERIIDERLNAGNKIQLDIKTKYMGADDTVSIQITSGSSSDEINALKYYVKSTIFSNWVYANLSGIMENDISMNAIENQKEIYRNMQNTDYNIIYDFQNSTKKIFDPTENPEKVDSRFNVHKTAIIKNSIQYNLNVAMSSYNEMSSQAFSFNMPVISDSEWQKITSRITVVSFMQGFNCGLKTYNNYAIVPSTNNEFTVIPNEIFYLAGTGKLNDEVSTYHRIDCPDFKYPITDDADVVTDTGYSFFKSKEVKYDKIYNKTDAKYEYDHKNFSCYKCVVNGNYKKPYWDGTNIIDASQGIYSTEIDMNALDLEKQKLYYVALAKERQVIYKSNAIVDSEGLQIFDMNALGQSRNIANCNLGAEGSERPINEIKEIRIVISRLNDLNKKNPVAEFKVTMNYAGGNQVIAERERLSVQEKEQTMIISVHSDVAEKLQSITIEKVYPELDDVVYYVKEVEIIYK